MRELVENALDACEAIRELPDIEITLEEFDTAGLNRLIGVTATERTDSSLYESAKTAASRKKSPVADKSAAAGGVEEGAPAQAAPQSEGGKRGKSESMYYRVTVRDNGCGMAHDLIPDMLG